MTTIKDEPTQSLEEQDLARWQQDFARLKVERDHLATELADNYPAFAARLAGIYGSLKL
jgi:hypothetical protein